MPELPEVEIVKEGLRRVLVSGVTISNVAFRRKNIRSPLPLKSVHKIIGQPLTVIRRRAKYIIIETPNAAIISHLGMTGTWRAESHPTTFKTHDHVVLELSNGMLLVYNDPRRFGVFDIIDLDKLNSDLRFRELGPEPLSTDFDFDYMWAKSRKKTAPVKSFLMDQRIVVGVGNIYACEALFEAGVSPLVPAGRLTSEQITRVIAAVRRILQQSIEAGGSSISDYTGVDEKEGSYQDNHLVYGRKGEPCHKCSHPISVKVIAGRSTFWCVKCQKTRQSKNNERLKTSRKKNLSRKSLSTASRTPRS